MLNERSVPIKENIKGLFAFLSYESVRNFNNYNTCKNEVLYKN